MTPKYFCKLIGIVLFALGLSLTILQASGYKWAFPWSTITLVISLVFQIIGWNEPFWYYQSKRKNQKKQ